MRFGLVCFVLIFLGAEFFQWIAHLTWLGELELSLPLTIFGGVCLAIASNYPSLKPASARSTLPDPQGQISSHPSQPVAPLQPSSVPAQGIAAKTPASISFRIQKPF